MRLAWGSVLAFLALLHAAAGHAKTIEFTGACDASAALLTPYQNLVVADDTIDVLYTYATDGGAPLYETNIYESTKVDPSARRNYADIEGAARIGKFVYLVASHSRSEKGFNQPNRRRLLALKAIKGPKREVYTPAGQTHQGLTGNFEKSLELRSLGLNRYILQLHRKMPHLAPQKQGLNIEALAPGPDGALWIALRNPRPTGRAVIISLTNPEDVILAAAEPTFAEPIYVDLGGLGIAGMALVPARNAYLILAAPHDRDGGTALFEWSGDPEEPPAKLPVSVPDDLFAETVVPTEDGASVYLLSDDGMLRFETPAEGCAEKLDDQGKCRCNRIRDRSVRRFRGQQLSLPAPAKP